MAKAYQLPSGQWRCQPMCGGERGDFIADSRIEAEYLAEQWKKGVRANKNKLCIEKAAERYIAARTAVYSPKTIKECKSMLRWLPAEIKEMDVHDVDQQQIQWWINEIAADLAPKTVKNRYGFLCAVIHDYHPELRVHCRLPQQKKPELYIPSTEEVKHLLSVFAAKDPEMYTAALMGSNMGLRRGEICALPNNKKDFQKRIINIHQAFVDNEQNELILKTVKTYHSQRILTAPRHVASHLLETPDQWRYIIRLSPHNVTQRFKSTVEKEFDHSFRFHDLRHFFASVLLAENVPERYIMEMLGHSTPNMIRNVYGHIMSEKETAIKKQVSDAFAFLS